jgi:hypothetical protein
MSNGEAIQVVEPPAGAFTTHGAPVMHEQVVNPCERDRRRVLPAGGGF